MSAPAASQAPATPQQPSGLSEREAGRRLVEHGRNEIAAQSPTPLYARVLAQLRDPLVMVLIGAVLLTIAIGDHADSIVIGLVILFNTTVGVTQEIRADNAVAALSAVSAPGARVLREGVPREVPATDVVPGDVLLLGEGDIVAADELLEPRVWRCSHGRHLGQVRAF